MRLHDGCGAVLNGLEVKAGQSVLVSGGGPVGLAGVMAAKAAGATTIILVDLIASRREAGRDLGATDVVDPGTAPVAEQVRAILPKGVERILDTSGAVPAIEGALGCLAARGRLAMVGVPKALDAAVTVPILQMLTLGASVIVVTEGHADPRAFVPYLIDLHRQGLFRFDRLITRFPLTTINEAVADQHAGRCVKVVLTV